MGERGAPGAPIPIGVRLPIEGAPATAERLLDVAALAEGLGYRSVWASDHVIIPASVRSRYPGASDGGFPYPPDHPWLEPLTALGVVAGACRRLELATGVLVLPQRQPVLVAKQAATLAHLSGGRLTLGIGAGWMEEEFRLLDAPFADRVARTRDAVALMRRLWAGGDLDGGRTHPLPPGGRIQLLWGGSSPATRRCIAELGDGWLSMDPTADALAAIVGDLRGLTERAGRDPDGLRIVAKPGLGFRATAEAVAEFAAAGATDLVLDPPHRLGPSAVREELHRVAEECGLRLR